MADDFLARRAEHWARLLTAIPSVTGSAGEADFPEHMAEHLRRSEAFLGDPQAVWIEPVPGGSHRRGCVLALSRGAGRRTVVLTGHFDTVETGSYGALQPLALDPDRLGPALVEKIAAEPGDPRARRAADEIAGGEFLAGRGLLDMKGGLAAGLAAMEATAKAGLPGNLLFIAVPDEEGNSAGARHMAVALAGIAAERGLDIEAVINLDAIGDDGDGGAGRVVALGSVGKLLPSALVVGRPAHAVDSFRGFGAAALAGALAAEVEWAPELTDRTAGELGAGPTLLGMKDSKTAYDVTMPASVWMYWNVMTHRRSPEAVLQAMALAASEAAAGLRRRLESRAASSGVDVRLPDIAVLRYEELAAEAAARGPAERLAALALELAQSDDDLPRHCGLMTELAWQLSGRTGPAVVLGFASIPYLPVRLGEDDRSARLARAVAAAIAEVGTGGSSIGTIGYFPGISDLSFFGQADETHVATIAANTPAWPTVLGKGGRFGAAGLPGINAGPWGRDYHTRLERLHRGYGFRTLPALVQAIVRNLLSSE